MSGHPDFPTEGIDVEANALAALEFYATNYTQLMFMGLGAGGERIVLGSKPFVCRFCDGKPPERTFRKRAHAVSEMLGNKIMVSLYECDQCNERFSKFEDDLAKMTLPMRALGGVIGKNGVPTLTSEVGAAKRKARLEIKDGTLHFSHDAGDASFVEDAEAKTLTYSYNQQPYRPLGAYKALCKSAFTLLPPAELGNFSELKNWLLERNLTTNQVYGKGLHLFYTSFVPAFRPFPQPIVALLKRNSPVEAPYMSFFIAFGNVSYQMFLPCPRMDEHLRGKTIRPVRYPHLFDLQPWRTPMPPQNGHEELSAPERTEKRISSMTWRYEQKIKRA
jgi:hypothetical protein